MLGAAFFHPLFQPASIFFEQKTSYSKTLAENSVRLGIACRPRDPLPADFILAGREPLLRQHFHQACLGIDNVQRERRIIITLRRITGGNNELVQGLKFRWHFDLVHSGFERQWDFELGQGWGRSIDALRRLLEPARDFRQVKSCELLRVETREPDASAFRTPDADIIRWHQKSSTVGIQRKSRLVGILLHNQRDQISQRSLVTVMNPGKRLPRGSVYLWKSFPIPGRWPNGAVQEFPQSESVEFGHQPAVGTPCGFT